MSLATGNVGGVVGPWAVRRSALWEQVATRICSVLPARMVGVFAHGNTTSRPGGEILSAVGIEPAFIETYRRLSPGNPWVVALHRAPRAGAVIGADLVPPFELVRTEFYRAWLRPLNVRHALIGTVQRDADCALFLIALRAPSQMPFGSADVQLLDLVLPALESAATLAGELASLRDRLDDFMGVFGMCPEALLVVDCNSHPVMLNPPARLLLSQADGLVLRHDVLTAASKEETNLLRGVITDAAHAGADLIRPGTVVARSVLISRPSGVPPLMLRVAGLPRPVFDPTGCPRHVAAVFARQPEGAEALGVFRGHYGMTPTEARLATLIAAGHSLLDAAAEMGISRNTARTHMKRIYAKTDTGRQVELVRLLGLGAGAAH